MPVANIVEASRVAGTTKMNARSSRSHAIVKLTLLQTNAAMGKTISVRVPLCGGFTQAVMGQASCVVFVCL